MKTKGLFLLIPWVVFSCVSTPTVDDKDIYTPLFMPTETEEHNFWDWPLPEIRFESYSYPYIDFDFSSMDDITFPLPNAEAVIAALEQRERNIRTRQVEVDPPTPAPQPPSPAPPSPPQVSDPQPAPSPPVNHLPEKHEVFSQGDMVILILPGGGWELDRENSSNVSPVSQNNNWQESQFSFGQLNPGNYTIAFKKQDHSTGGWMKQVFRINLNEVRSEALPTETVEDSGTGESNKESLLKELEDNENTRDIAKKIDILERLLLFHWADEELAGFYYRLARELEKQGHTQDLDRAFELYKTIEEQFFLTSYYDPALDRILFINQHFYRLQ